MNSLMPELATERLLFSWDSPRRLKAGITAFVALSLIAHALCFYIFQIIYPPTVALLPPPARITLITPASDEGRTLLRWIDAEDPALAFTTHRPSEARLRALPKVEHVPSYLAVGFHLRKSIWAFRVPFHLARYGLLARKPHPPMVRQERLFRFQMSSMRLAFRPTRSRASRHPTTKHPKRLAFASP